MKRFIRLDYLAPRLIAIAVVYSAVQWIAGLALHHTAADGLAAALGAKAEIGRTRVSLSDARVVMQGVSVSPTSRPGEKLLEADSIELDLETQPMLMRRLVVENARVRGLRIGSPRSVHASSESVVCDPTEKKPSPAAPRVDRLVADWSERLGQRLSRDLQAEFRSPQIAQEMSLRWPARYEQANAKAQALRADAARFRTDASRASRNPLRNGELIDDLPARAASLEERMASLSADLRSLPVELDDDFSRLQSARRRDEQLIRRTLSTTRLDADTMAEALLSEQLAGPIEELIAWVRWSRSLGSATPVKGRSTPRARGVDLHFGDAAPRPGVLVRSVEVRGTAQLSGRPTELRGLVTNLSSAPARQIAPTRIVIESTDGVRMNLTATLDRSGETPMDEVLFDCPAWALLGREVGEGEAFSLKMDPAVASLSARVRVEGDLLRGGVQLVQEHARVRSSDELLSARLQQELEQRPRLATRVTLSGSLARPGVALTSTLATTLSKTIQTHAEQRLQARRAQLLTLLSEQIDHQIAVLNELAGSHEAHLAAELDGPLGELQGIAADWNHGNAAHYQRIGKRLPEGSLFR